MSHTQQEEIRVARELEDELAGEATLESESDRVLAGVMTRHGLAGDREADASSQRDLARRLAALTVRRATNQHGCKRRHPTDLPCEHEDHRRDVAYCEAMLEALDLPGEYPVVTVEERKKFTGSVAQRIPRHGGRRERAAHDKGWNRPLK